jgi:zinc protease
MKKYVLLLVLLASGISISPATRAEEKPLFDYKTITLDNGLKVISLEDFSCPVVALQLWYHVGSKDEKPDRQGFAHMFEHMMFQGTDRLGPTGHFDSIHRVGGACNAYTNFDETVYHEVVPANQLELAMYLESERMAFLKIDQHSFDTERKVVEEERRMGVNQPYGTLFEKVMPEIYTVHPYRWTPIGQIPHLRAATVGELREFWTRYYVPSNATLVIVGAVKHEDVEALARKYFGWIPKYPEPARVTVEEPPQNGVRTVKIKEQNAPTPLLALVYRTVGLGHEDRVALQVLSQILCEGNSSRVYRRLVANDQTAAFAQGLNFSLEKDGVFAVGTAMPPLGGDTPKALKGLEEEVDKIRAEPVTASELSKARNQMLKAIVCDSLTVENKASLLGRTAVIEGKLENVNSQLQRINAVTVADVQRVAQKYLTPEHRLTLNVERNLLGTLLGKWKKEEDAPVSAVPEKDSPKPGREGVKRPDDFPATPPAAAATKLDLTPKFTTQTLPNGLKVVVVTKHGVPFVSVRLGLQAGAYTEPKPGLANIALQMLTKGTAKHSEGELAQELDTYGISLNGSATLDSCSITAECMTEHLERAMNLLGEVVLTPAFNEKEFTKLKTQIRSGLAISTAEAEYVANTAFRKQLYGAHPYARTETGEVADVDALNVNELHPWWTQIARPDMATLIFAGDIELDRAVGLAQLAFDGWKAEGPKPEYKLPDLPAPAETHIYLVDRPGSVQSQIRVGQPGITTHHPKYFTSTELSAYFGGSFGSRLNEEIRVKKGLTYGAHGGFLVRRFAGEFRISTFSKNETTAQAVQAVIDEVNRLRTEPPSQTELDDQKAYIQGSFVRNRETPQAVANDLWVLETEGQPVDFYSKMMAAIATTTSDDCVKLAQTAVDPSKLIIIVVGDGAQLKAGLEKIAPVSVLPAK